MASSKSFLLLLCALFALVFILSSEVSTLDASTDTNKFGNLKVECEPLFKCCHYSRYGGYCTHCCNSQGAEDQNQIVLASMNNRFGIDCYGLQCCHTNRQGYCTACCAVANSNKLQTDQESSPVNDVVSEIIAMVESDV